MSDDPEILRLEIRRLLADLERAQSDRDEAMGKLAAAEMEVAALRKTLDKKIYEQAHLNPDG
jgi:hypothetical protein